MTREDQILIQILAAFTNGRSIGSLRDVSLEALYQAAQKHNVGGIVSSMLQPVLKTRAEDPAVRNERIILHPVSNLFLIQFMCQQVMTVYVKWKTLFF